MVKTKSSEISDVVVSENLRRLKQLSNDELGELIESGVDFIIDSTSGPDYLLPAAGLPTQIYFEIQIYAAEALERNLTNPIEHIKRLEDYLDRRARELRREFPEEANLFKYLKGLFSPQKLRQMYDKVVMRELAPAY